MVDLEVAVRKVHVADSHVGDDLVFTHADARVDEVGVGGRPQQPAPFLTVCQCGDLCDEAELA